MTKMQFIEDKEIYLSEEEDLLKTKIYADNLVKVIESTPPNKVFTIGLFGSWGVGKSSVIRTAQQELENHSEKIKFITYDAWKYANDSFRRMFLLKVREELHVSPTSEMKRFYESESIENESITKISYGWLVVYCVIFVSVMLLMYFSNNNFDVTITFSIAISLVSLFVALKRETFKELKVHINRSIIFAPEQFEDCFREMVGQAFKKDNCFKQVLKYIRPGKQAITGLDKLVFVIDNIDRCHNAMAYELLTDIKTFLSSENHSVVFVIPVDDQALKHNLFANNQNESECIKEKEEFLRKFFNVTMRIKPHQIAELNTFAKQLNAKNNLGFNEDTIALCSKEFAQNPRRIIQLINNLTLELNYYPVDFIKENESLICAMLILKEEYPTFYQKVLENVNNLLNLEDTEMKDASKSSELKAFFRIANPIFRVSKTEDILKIITNSDAVFEAIPLEIRDAIRTYDQTVVSEYLKSTTVNMLSYDLIKKNTSENLKSGSINQILNSLEFLAELQTKVRFSETFFTEVFTQFKEWYSQLLPNFAKDKYWTLCLLANRLDQIRLSDLKEDIFKYITSNKYGSVNDDFNDSNLKCNYLFVQEALKNFKSKNDNKLFAPFISNWFMYDGKFFEYFKDFNFSKEQRNQLFSNHLLFALISTASIWQKDDLKNIDKERILWLLKHKTDISVECYSELIRRIASVVPSQSVGNHAQLMGYIANVTDYLSLIPDGKVINFDDWGKIKSVLKARQNYNSEISIAEKYKDEVSHLHLVCDFLLNLYRLSSGVISSSDVVKLMQYDREYLLNSLVQLIDKGYMLEPFIPSILKDTDYSSESLLVLTEFCFAHPDIVERNHSDQEWIQNKVKTLCNNINNKKVLALIEQLVNDARIKDVIRVEICNRNAEYINELPSTLLDLALENFDQKTAFSFADNLEFLRVVAQRGNENQKYELLRVFSDCISKKSHIDEIFSILETIQLEKNYNKQEISAALQSYKDRQKENIDSRVYGLIDKFNK